MSAFLERLNAHARVAQWLVLAGVLLLLGSVVGWNLYSGHQAIDAGERERLATQTNVVDENLERQLTSTKHALDSIRSDLPTLKARKDSKAQLDHQLQVVRDAMFGARAISVFDADGTLIARSPDEFVGQNFSSRGYFQVARQGMNPSTLYVAPPFLAATGDYVLNVSEVLLDDKGAFAGVILVSLDPAYFRTLMQSVLYAPDMRTSLIHGDGKVVFRAPDPQGIVGVDLTARPGAFFVEHMKSAMPINVYKGVVASTGEARLTVLRTIQPAAVSMDKPLVIAVSRELSALFAPWRGSAFVHGGLFFLLVVTTTLGLHSYQRRQRAYGHLLADREAVRKKTERDLQESEESLAITLNSIGDAVIATDATGRVTRMNASAERLSGWTLADAAGRPLSDVFRIVNALTRETVPDPVQLVMAQGKVVGLANHTVLLARGGREYQIADSASPIRNAGDEIVGVVLVFSDVTEQYRAEETLRLTRFSVDAASDALFWMTPDARIVDVNAAACRSLGYTREELLRLRVPDVDARFNEELWPQHFAELRRRGSMTFESEQRSSEGRLFPVEIVANYVKYGGEERNCAFVRDITERKRTEKSLRDSEELYRTLLINLSSGVVVHRADTSILFSNAAAASFLGLSEDQLLGKAAMDSAWCFLQEDGTPMPLKDYPVNRVIASGKELRNYVVGMCRPDRAEPAWGLCNAYPVRDEEGAILQVVVTFTDITERTRAAKEKAALEIQVQQAQKMESVGRLAGGVAHDFNNMLTVILGNVAMAIEHVDPAQPLHTDLVEIRKAANRSADLTRQLLAFARKQVVAPMVLDLNETVPGIIKMLQRLIGEDISLTWRPEANLWRVKVDPSQIDQILANLCINARDAIAGVGNIVIETGNRTLDESYCAVHAGCVPGDYARISVSDNGHGIDKETLAHIFEPFFTTKGAGEGTGLGLATVYGAVKQNNGFINVYSEPGTGTTFTIYLPRQEGGDAREQTTDSADPAGRGQETILLVEDEPSILKLAERVLARQGYAVLPAKGPGEAIRIAGEHAGVIHLLTTDVVMPEMNGRDLARNLQSRYPGLKVLFMSGYTANIIVHQGVLDQGVHFIQKPFSIDELTAKVREVLDSA